MGFLDSVRSWFRTEAAEAGDLLGDTRNRLEADLDRREAELNATPAERMEQLQAQIADADGTFDGLRDKIEGRGLGAEATAEVADLEAQATAEVADLEAQATAEVADLEAQATGQAGEATEPVDAEPVETTDADTGDSDPAG